MKSGAKKGLLVICVLYALTVGVMIWNFKAEAEPDVTPAELQQKLEEVRQWAYDRDPRNIRTTEISEDEAAGLMELIARRGQIININYTLIMQCLNFGILLLLLYGWLWDPLLAFLDERRRSVRERLQSAEENRRRAEELREKRREELNQLRSERTQILEQARASAERQRTDIVEHARQEADRIAEQAGERLDEEVRRARITLREEVADLATRIAGRVLEREVRTEDHESVIERMIERLSLEPASRQTEGAEEE